MLEKWTLELVDQPGLGFYSHIFLIQKATGLEACYRPVDPERGCHPHQVMKETQASVLESVRKYD